MHVIPEGFFRLERDEKESPIILTNVKGQYPRRSPIGEYDTTLLCDICEQTFGHGMIMLSSSYFSSLMTAWMYYITEEKLPWTYQFMIIASLSSFLNRCCGAHQCQQEIFIRKFVQVHLRTNSKTELTAF